MIISIPLAVYICVPRLLTRQMWKALRGRSANGLLYYIRLPQVSMRSVLIIGWGAPIAPLNPHCIVYVYSCRADFPGRLPSAQPRREATCLAMALRRPTVFDRYQWVKTRDGHLGIVCSCLFLKIAWCYTLMNIKMGGTCWHEKTCFGLFHWPLIQSGRELKSLHTRTANAALWSSTSMRSTWIAQTSSIPVRLGESKRSRLRNDAVLDPQDGS